MNLILAPETWPFAVAGLLMLSIAAIEGIALLIGASAMGWVDSLLHHSPDALLHHSPDAPDSPDSWLGWLHLGKVPLLVLVVLFLALFTLVGFALNLAAAGVFGAMIPPLISAPVAAVAALPLMRVCAGGIAHLIPSDQTYAVSFDTLVGRVAVIVSGTARLGYPAQGKVTSRAWSGSLCDGRARCGGGDIRSERRGLAGQAVERHPFPSHPQSAAGPVVIRS